LPPEASEKKTENRVSLDVDLERRGYAVVVKVGGAIDLRFQKGRKIAEGLRLEPGQDFVVIPGRKLGYFVLIPMGKILTEQRIREAFYAVNFDLAPMATRTLMVSIREYRAERLRWRYRSLRFRLLHKPSKK
jgi:hypothetical protein